MFSASKTTAPSGSYNLTKSLRFRRSASAWLNRTPSSSGNQQKWTWSGWVKRGQSAASTSNQVLFGCGTSTSNYLQFGFSTAGSYTTGSSDESLGFGQSASGVNSYVSTNAVYRDYSSWYHVICAVDTTQATDTNRVKIYINGVQQTILSGYSYPAQNANLLINSTITHGIGYANVYSNYFDGYLAETNFVDGQQLTPSLFGANNATTGVWQPIKYTGTYGTNGFYLPFTDVATTSGSNAGLGKDFSGNGNYWNTNNISVTTGSTYDSMTDIPTLTSATAANYCTWNPLLFYSTTAPTVTNGNLTAGWNNTSMFCGSTMTCPSTGKTYAEFTLTTANTTRIGIKDITDQSQYNGGYTYVANTGTIRNTSDTTVQTVATSTNGDIIGIAVDLSANTIQFYKNNTAIGTAVSIANSANWAFWVGQNGSGTAIQVDANFGQRPFAYTPPTGFVALNTYNLPDSTIVAGNKYMDATLWTGDAVSPKTVYSNLAFQPDMTWAKTRSVATQHALYDSLRGAGSGKILIPNTTDPEGGTTGSTSDAQYGYLSSFNSNGISTVTGSSGVNYFFNATGVTYVGWNWKAGQGTTSSNTNGSITSTVSVNASAGFSVVTYTGNGTSGATVGHGLGVAPSMVITKCRSNTNTYWQTYHASLGNTKVLYLNNTDASATSSASWNNTSPTSTVFSLGNGSDGNGSTFTYVAYCWSEIAGFSKFGSYTGNGSTDGPFVYTGFRPKFVLRKRTDTTAYWVIMDSVRNSYNLTDLALYPNDSLAESSDNGYDLLSNGFKIRASGSNENASGGTYIYMAFAENPFKNALAR